jgi:hypothetical protein
MTLAIKLPGTPIGNLRGLLDAVRDQANAVLAQDDIGTHTTDAACAIYDRANDLIALLVVSIRVDENEAERDAEITSFVAKMVGDAS